MSLDMRHSDIECALRRKNSAESGIDVCDAIVAARVEQPSVGAIVRAAATTEPTSVRKRKAGVIPAPGLIAV